jgi:alkylated DNA repair dioxygenase AlkB
MLQEPAINIIDEFLPNHAELFTYLASSVQWDDSMAARRTASFGKPYNYSQISYPDVPMLPGLNDVADKLLKKLNVSFNNCLLNYYETGDNTMGFHSDDTSNLIPGTGVAIVSLGSVRDITYRSKTNPGHQVSFALRPGSLLYMDDAVQVDWLHAIKKQTGAGSRISLTWRAFV